MRFVEPNPDLPFPTNREYDAAITSMQQDITEEGGAAQFLGMIRAGRRNGEAMQRRVLEPMRAEAFKYEDYTSNGLPPKTNLAMSRAFLSGMLFGHVANEAVYGSVYDVDPYRPRQLANLAYAGMEEEGFLEALDQNPVIAHRLAIQAMASMCTDSLTRKSFMSIQAWSKEMVGVERQGTFVAGFGLAMYRAWDAYSDNYLAYDRAREVYYFPAMTTG